MIKKNQIYAYYGILILVDHIKNNENLESIDSMTYKEFSKEINDLGNEISCFGLGGPLEKQMPHEWWNNCLTARFSGAPLDIIGKSLSKFDDNSPLITILIINDSDYPGSGFDEFYTGFSQLIIPKKDKIIKDQKKSIKEYAREGKLDKFLSEIKSNPDFAALSIMENSFNVAKAQRIKKDDFLHKEQGDDNSMVAEGVTSKAHYEIENRSRNSSNARKKKKLFGYNCECCGFNFLETYGTLGGKYIECHHIKPLAEFNKEGEKVGLKGLALLCSNCHRMIHRLLSDNKEKYKGHYCLSIDDLRDMVEKQKPKP